MAGVHASPYKHLHNVTRPTMARESTACALKNTQTGPRLGSRAPIFNGLLADSQCTWLAALIIREGRCNESKGMQRMSSVDTVSLIRYRRSSSRHALCDELRLARRPVDQLHHPGQRAPRTLRALQPHQPDVWRGICHVFGMGSSCYTQAPLACKAQKCTGADAWLHSFTLVNSMSTQCALLKLAR